jgi:hypothetical protein
VYVNNTQKQNTKTGLKTVLKTPNADMLGWVRDASAAMCECTINARRPSRRSTREAPGPDSCITKPRILYDTSADDDTVSVADSVSSKVSLALSQASTFVPNADDDRARTPAENNSLAIPEVEGDASPRPPADAVELDSSTSSKGPEAHPVDSASVSVSSPDADLRAEDEPTTPEAAIKFIKLQALGKKKSFRRRMWRKCIHCRELFNSNPIVADETEQELATSSSAESAICSGICPECTHVEARRQAYVGKSVASGKMRSKSSKTDRREDRAQAGSVLLPQRIACA